MKKYEKPRAVPFMKNYEKGPQTIDFWAWKKLR